MQNKKPVIITVFSLIGLIIIATVGLVWLPQASKQWNKPLGPGLELPTYTPFSETITPPTPVTVAPTIAASPNVPQAVLVTATLAPTATATPAPLCGGPAVMIVLGVGADSGYDYRYGLSDVMRIARVDFTTPKVSVLSMPRDLWVQLPDGIASAAGNVVTHSKLNQAYFYGGPGMGYYDGPGAGPGLLARTLDLNFGLRVDHYGAVNMQTFVKLVDAVGGIDIDLPEDVDGRPIDENTADMGYFSAGQHHFSGEEALRFARIRKKYNDFTRMDNQNLVICALKEKVTSPAVVTKIPQIIAAFQGSILTDLSPAQLSQLACLAPSLKRENLLFTSLPQEILQPSRVYSPIQKDETFILDADFEVIRDYVARFMVGTWPDKPKEPTCP